MYIDKLDYERVEDDEALSRAVEILRNDKDIFNDFVDSFKSDILDWFYDYEEGSDNAMPPDTLENLGMSESDFWEERK